MHCPQGVPVPSLSWQLSPAYTETGSVCSPELFPAPSRAFLFQTSGSGRQACPAGWLAALGPLAASAEGRRSRVAQAGPQLQAPLLREADSYLWVETRSCQNSPNPSSDSPLASPTQRTRYVQGVREQGVLGREEEVWEPL